MRLTLVLKYESPCLLCVSCVVCVACLGYSRSEGQDAPIHDPSRVAQVDIDIKWLSKFLFAEQVRKNSRIVRVMHGQMNPDNVVCCFVGNNALMFHVILGELYVTYYVPAMAAAS